MNTYQTILTSMFDLSTDEINKICGELTSIPSTAAKITGAGKGGDVVAYYGGYSQDTFKNKIKELDAKGYVIHYKSWDFKNDKPVPKIFINRYFPYIVKLNEKTKK